MSIEELKQDPFSPDEFIERLAWRANQEGSFGGAGRAPGRLPAAGDNGASALTDFSPMLLHGAFCEQIEQLKNHEHTLERSAQQLEQLCIEEEKAHWKRVKDLQRKNQSAFQTFQELDERINFVATKVVHLGDQLESVNLPRRRNAEALHLMKYLDTFLEQDGALSAVEGIFDDTSQLPVAADLIQKLHAVAQELPQDSPAFKSARERILRAHSKVEYQLKEGFMTAYFKGDIPEMKRLSDLLVNFHVAHSQVIDQFIEESQKFAFAKGDIFEEVLSVCQTASNIVKQVFSSHEAVMTKFVNIVYNGKLREHIMQKLSDRSKLEQYLKWLNDLYDKTTKLSIDIAAAVRLGSDTTFLIKLTNKNLFGEYLATYVRDEEKYLKDKCAFLLHSYYERRGHVKKQLQSGGIYEFRRDLQARMNINLGAPIVESSNGSGSGSGDVEIFLSQEVAISMLQEFKIAYKRSQLLANKAEVAECVKTFFELLIQYLCVEFIDYAIELGLCSCPLSEPKSEPSVHFLAIAADTSAISHLLEKQFADSVWPIVSLSADVQKQCLAAKQQVIEHIEQRIDTGLERTLQGVIGYVKFILASEQKKNDFKPEGNELPTMTHSQACSRVVKYISAVTSKFKDQLDGRNLSVVLSEFGVRVHRIIYDHLVTFQYNSVGAMLVICDINEYRNCVKELNSDLVTQLFDVLHGLCNLLVVPVDNLRQVCSGDPLGTLDRSVIMTFMQLRSDHKTAKLATLFSTLR